MNRTAISKAKDFMLETRLGKRACSQRTMQLCAVLMLVFVSTLNAWAQDTSSHEMTTVRISEESASVTAGDWLDFTTVVRNHGTSATPDLVAHLSVASMTRGPFVDLEEWSPQVTQYLTPLSPGESRQLNWKLHPLFEGSFTAYVTVVSAHNSLQPVASKSLQLLVGPDNILPWEHVIPVVVLVPLFPLLLLVVSIGYTRRVEKKRDTEAKRT